MSTVETEIIARIENGDVQEFNVLMQQYQHLVYRIVWNYTKNRDDAMDLTQNVFIKVYQNLGSFRGSGSFKSWISQIAAREGINYHRKHRFLSGGQPEMDTDNIAGDEPNREDELLAREHRQELLRSLFALNTRYRLAVVLRYYENMSIREIAGILKCSEDVVKNMLYRSLQRLRKILSAQLN